MIGAGVPVGPCGSTDASAGGLPERLAARTMLREAEVLWEHGILEYLFLVARKP